MSIGRILATGFFSLTAAAAVPGAVGAVGEAAVDPGLRPSLIAAYTLLRLAVVAAFTVFVLRRGPSRRRSREPVAFVACAVAIGSSVALAGPGPEDATALVLAGEAMTLASCGWLLASVLALGRCFGVLPEARGLVTSGPYSIVRHPVYLGELGAYAGLVVAAPGPRNLVLIVAFFAAQAVRMRLEERSLTEAFPEYVRYAETVPRLFPAVAVGRLGGRLVRAESNA